MHCSTRARPIDQRVNIVSADAQNFTCLGRGEIAIIHHVLNEMDQFFPGYQAEARRSAFSRTAAPLLSSLFTRCCVVLRGKTVVSAASDWCALCDLPVHEFNRFPVFSEARFIDSKNVTPTLTNPRKPFKLPVPFGSFVIKADMCQSPS